METKVNKRKRRRHTRNANGSGYLVMHGGVYHARWCVNGKRVSKSLKTSDLETAKAELARLSVQRAGQADRQTLRKIAQVISSTMTDVSDKMKLVSIPVSSIFALFRDAPNRPHITPGTLKSYECQFNVFVEWLRARHPEVTNARDISQSIADEYAQHRRTTKSANTHNKDLNLFTQAWRTLAVRYGLDYNPWTEDRIARLPLTPNTRRNLTRAECRKIIAAATLEERCILSISLLAALRMGDCVRLKWEDIDLTRNWLTKVQRKTGREVAVPIVAPLRKLLLKWRSETGNPSSGYVFPDQVARLKANGNTENISRTFMRLFERAGIKTHQIGADGKPHRTASFHSLRHTFITNLIESGVDPLLVKEAAGHSVMATTARYTHIGETALRRALTKAATVAASPD